MNFFLTGILLGLQAGCSPGPVITMLITESVLHGRRAGMKFALVPVLTDLPIVALAIPLLYYLTGGAEILVGFFSMAGAVLLFYLGWKSMSVSKKLYEERQVKRLSLFKAVAVNFFNPNLYIYWVGICGPLCVQALHQSTGTLAVFLVSFYCSITFFKFLVAVTAGTARHSLSISAIVWLNRLLGLSLMIFSGVFFYQGVQFFTGNKTL